MRKISYQNAHLVSVRTRHTKVENVEGAKPPPGIVGIHVGVCIRCVSEVADHSTLLFLYLNECVRGGEEVNVARPVQVPQSANSNGYIYARCFIVGHMAGVS